MRIVWDEWCKEALKLSLLGMNGFVESAKIKMIHGNARAMKADNRHILTSKIGDFGRKGGAYAQGFFAWSKANSIPSKSLSCRSKDVCQRLKKKARKKSEDVFVDLKGRHTQECSIQTDDGDELQATSKVCRNLDL